MLFGVEERTQPNTTKKIIFSGGRFKLSLAAYTTTNDQWLVKMHHFHLRPLATNVDGFSLAGDLAQPLPKMVSVGG